MLTKCVAAAGVLVTAVSWGAPGDLVTIIENPHPDMSSYFGSQVKTIGQQLVISAPDSDDVSGVYGAGAVYVFDNQFQCIQTLSDPAPVEDEYYGGYLSVSGNQLAVAARYAPAGNTYSGGKVFLYQLKKGGAVASGVIENPMPETKPAFGRYMAFSPSSLAVGALGESKDSGAVFFFNRRNSVFSKAIYPSVEGTSQDYGHRIVYGGKNLFISSTGAPAGAYSGAVHVYDAFSGAYQRTIENPAPEDNAYFGFDLAGQGNTLYVGAVGATVDGVNSGCVYAYNTSNMSQRYRLVDPDKAPGAHFGWDVDALGKHVLVGAMGDSTDGPQTGRAYLFDASTGNHLLTLKVPQNTPCAWLGWSVAFFRNYILVGACGAEVDGKYNVGRVYVFEGM